jgi:hypothetical protein
MLRDKLGELSMAGDVEIVKKVPPELRLCFFPYMKLIFPRPSGS